MQNVYITGASGMLGSEITGHLAALPGYAPRAVSRRPCPALPADHPGQRVTGHVFGAEWLDPGDVSAPIVHCAGLSDPRAEFRNFADLARAHILPHVDMVEALLARGWRGRLVYLSAAAIYGEALSLPIPETHPTGPKSFYGLHKLCLERAYIDLARARGFELMVLRVSNPYGARVEKPSQGVIGLLFNAFRTGKTFRIIGDGSGQRDYLEISDFLRAVELSLAAGTARPDTVLNIGSGTGVSLNALIEMLSGITGKRLNTVQVPVKHDVKSNVLDCARANTVLGWQAQVPLETGLRKLAERRDVHHVQP